MLFQKNFYLQKFKPREEGWAICWFGTRQQTWSDCRWCSPGMEIIKWRTAKNQTLSNSYPDSRMALAAIEASSNVGGWRPISLPLKWRIWKSETDILGIDASRFFYLYPLFSVCFLSLMLLFLVSLDVVHPSFSLPIYVLVSVCLRMPRDASIMNS